MHAWQLHKSHRLHNSPPSSHPPQNIWNLSKLWGRNPGVEVISYLLAIPLHPMKLPPGIGVSHWTVQKWRGLPLRDHKAFALLTGRDAWRLEETKKPCKSLMAQPGQESSHCKSSSIFAFTLLLLIACSTLGAPFQALSWTWESDKNNMVTNGFTTYMHMFL